MIDITALDPETTYILVVDPETAPDPETLAPLLNQLHERNIHALVVVGALSVHTGDTELTEAARRLTDLDTELTDDDRAELAQLLVSTAIRLERSA